MPQFFNSTAMNKKEIMASREDRYPMLKVVVLELKVENGFKKLMHLLNEEELKEFAQVKNLVAKLVLQDLKDIT